MEIESAQFLQVLLIYSIIKASDSKNNPVCINDIFNRNQLFSKTKTKKKAFSTKGGMVKFWPVPSWLLGTTALLLPLHQAAQHCEELLGKEDPARPRASQGPWAQR
jgi:hypothetical protein